MLLNKCIKNYTYDQDKAIPPEQTVKNVLNVLTNSNLNIFEGLTRVDKDINIPIYCCKGGLDFIKYTNRTNTTGKGITETQAQASALMEMVERFSAGVYRENNYNVQSSYSELKKQLPDFNLLFPLIKQIPNQEEELKNIENIPLYWTKSYSLTHKKITYIPYIYQEIVGSNGLAAGNTLEEAILQGLCEVIERHNIAQIELNKLATPLININSINDSLSLALLAKYKQVGIKLVLKDFTLDIPVPTLGAVASYKDKNDFTYIAAGTSTSPHKALYRALTELPQYVRNPPLMNENFVRDFFQELNSKFFRQGITRVGTLPKQNSEFLNISDKIIDFSNLVDLYDNDIKNEIDRIVDILASQNREVVVTILTHPQINIPVVRVIVLNTLLNVPETNISLYYYLGLIFLKIQQFDKAIHYLLKAQELDSDYYKIYNQIGFCYYSLYKQTLNTKYLEFALNNFKKSIELEPNNALDYGNIASILLIKGETLNAFNYFKEALKLSPIYKFTPLYSKFVKLGLNILDN